MKYTSAIVLAGGLGTRLRSVVGTMPKPLAPINGRPFLSYVLEHLAAQGVKEVILATGYEGHQIEEAFGNEFGELQLRYSQEEEALGTGGAVALALRQHNSTEPLWVVNGDTFFSCSLDAVARAHEDNAADITLALCDVKDASRYGLVALSSKMEGGGALIDHFGEKSPGSSGLINAGVYLLSPPSFQRFDVPQRFSLEKDFFERHLEDMRLIGCPQNGYFVDIGVPEDYERAQNYFVGRQ